MSTPATRPDTTRLQRLAHSYRDSAALMAAVALGLFTRVACGAETEAAVAQALDLTPTNAERLVTACVALGLLVRDGDRVRNAPDVARFLVEGEPTYAGPWMLFSKPDWNEWGRLAGHLGRRDAVVLGKYAHGFTVEQARKYREATYSIGMGAADRVTAQAGDFTRDPLPAGADVVIMASNLPQYNREIIQTVITRAFAALSPGGEMHLIGEMLDDRRGGPRDPALWGLAEALWGSTGVAHSVAECRAYFERAGARDVAVHEFVAGVLTRVTGRRPG